MDDQHHVFQLITNVMVIDGTNTPARKASVRVKNDRIEAVGDLTPNPEDSIVDGDGFVLTPGFIDTHSHLDRSLFQKPDAISVLNQGVTTVIVGQDGYSDPMDQITAEIGLHPIAVNMASYTGQSSLRDLVMKDGNLHRTTTAMELDSMKIMLSAEMEKGSLGLSTGLEYEEAHFSSHEEVIELAKIAARYQGRYISHMRSEDVGLSEAIDETINIGRVAKLPVQISHIKIALKKDWGTATRILDHLDHARQDGVNITADCYPYEYWSSTLRVLFPKTDYTNVESDAFAVNETLDTSASIILPFAPNRNYEGKTITEIAKMRHEAAAQTVISPIALVDEYEKKNPNASRVQGIIAKSMDDDDIMHFLSWAHTNICTDGWDGGNHPRGYGAFTRVLANYVRNKKIMSLENAIYKMTALAAEHTGITDRGVIAPGYYADIVLLDPITVQDNATIQDPSALSDGIHKVWVNGKIVFEDKKSMKRYPGVFLKRQSM